MNNFLESLAAYEKILQAEAGWSGRERYVPQDRRVSPPRIPRLAPNPQRQTPRKGYRRDYNIISGHQIR